MTRFILAFLLAMVSTLASAQPRPDLTPGQADGLRDQRAYQDNYPRWCRDFDRRDYWRERRACGDDRDCRHHVERKARRCGLR